MVTPAKAALLPVLVLVFVKPLKNPVPPTRPHEISNVPEVTSAWTAVPEPAAAAAAAVAARE